MMRWYNILRKNRRKSLYLLLILLFVALCLSGYLFRHNDSNNLFSVLLKEPYYFITHLFNRNNQRVDDKDYQALDLENQALRVEIKALQDLLAVDSLITGYEKISATVINRKNLEWYNTLIINKGSSSGLVNGLAVINGQGLIGKLIDVTPNTSTIKLLTNNLKVSVLIINEEKEVYGVLSSYNPTTNLFIIEGISDIVDIKRGDKVMTTGLSEVFTKGLMIGTVKDIKLDSFGLSKILEVTPSVNYNNIFFVTVLKKEAS